MNIRLRSVRTGTIQYSPYQPELRGNGTVVTDDCDHERHACATKNTCLSTKQTSNAKKTVLLLELQEHFHSQEKNLLSKKAVHKEEAYYKKGWVAVKGDVNDGLGR